MADKDSRSQHNTKQNNNKSKGSKYATVLRHLYSRERPRKAWLNHEAGLVNLHRKLSEEERMRVYVLAERFVLARIRRRLEQARLRSRRARNVRGLRP